MTHVNLILDQPLGYHFIPSEFLPKGKGEYYLRNAQSPKQTWRTLTSEEIEILKSNGNRSDHWEDVWVRDVFDPSLIIRSTFYGRVRIGRIEKGTLEHHDLQEPVGIADSTLISSDIGDDVAIHHVHHLSHMVIGNRCLLMNIDEMLTTHHAKFGNGILKDGEPESSRAWIDVMNEAGGRRILPFEGLLPADAYLWAKYRDDALLQQKLVALTDTRFDSRHGSYGTVGDDSVIKHCRILKDARIGSHCFIQGADKLENVTVRSNANESTQIGEGVELVDGIVGYGCHIWFGSKAVRFVLGNNCRLNYGARLIHSVLGDNSTISCCEVLNNLIFPGHEQHHNNSFLIASVILGQSNVAAGATIGSNHNSRANDNEVEAGRGFWPGLCTSIKHSSRFASFTLLAKGAYPAELNIPLPFSLVNNNESQNQLEVMPAFGWLHNMYALERNPWKYQTRDERVSKAQPIEFNSLAPDTIEEIINALGLLELWTAKASMKAQDKSVESMSEKQLTALGASLLSESSDALKDLTVLGENMEKSRRPTVILHAEKSYHAYRQMLHLYAIRNLMAFIQNEPVITREGIHDTLGGKRMTDWVNLGGQLCPGTSVVKLRSDIGSGKLKSWDAIHNRYEALWKKYPLEKQKHAYRVLCFLFKTKEISKDQWNTALDEAVRIQMLVSNRVYDSRKKDYENPFIKLTFQNPEEMAQVIGTIDQNQLIQKVQKETQAFKKEIGKIKKRLA